MLSICDMTNILPNLVNILLHIGEFSPTGCVTGPQASWMAGPGRPHADIPAEEKSTHT